MSDYLVTSTELTETADAIRAKTGDANTIDWESGTGFADAVAAIPSGGGSNPFEFVGTLVWQNNYWSFDNNNKREFYISAPNATELSGFNNLNGTLPPNTSCETTFIVDIPQQTTLAAHTMRMLNYGAAHSFKFIFPSGLRYDGAIYFLYDIKNVTEIIGEIDMSGASSIGTACMSRPTNLKKIFFKQNSAKVIFNFNDWGGAPLLEDESIVSIANALSESASGMTLTLHATPKARCSSILGTVLLDAETQTYHVFAQDAQGTVTLADFITNTKGWTLA